MIKHRLKRNNKHLENYKKIQKRKTEEQDNGCLKVSQCLSSYFF